MHNGPMRLACPACLGVVLAHTNVAQETTLDHCGRCGGTWIPRTQIDRLRAVPAEAVRAMVTRADDAGFLCHSCHSPMDRNAARCAGCRWSNALECPSCGKGLERTTAQGVTVDVCRRCEGVWLDHHELSSLWAAAAAVAVANHGGVLDGMSSLADASSLLDVLFYAPDLVHGAAYVAVEGVELVSNVAGAGLEAASNAGGLLSGVGDVLGVVGDAAGAVFGVIGDVFSIFDGF
ncbi:MAG TPA: zf-TFIIB domain-containing protein [Longimicrobium sp.]|nr:zf-TFIIB domain-containing protein [Longimicrobium sp.]